MATKLIKPVSREVEIQDVYGIKGLAIVTIFHDRVEIRRKGTSRTLSVEWKNLGKVLKIPHNAPAKHVANPLGWIVEE